MGKNAVSSYLPTCESVGLGSDAQTVLKRTEFPRIAIACKTLKSQHFLHAGFSASVTVGFGNVDKSLHQIWMEHSNGLLGKSEKRRKEERKNEKTRRRKLQMPFNIGSCYKYSNFIANFGHFL